MPANSRISVLRRLDEQQVRELSEVTIDCVEGGASIGFMWPMTQAKADAYWRGASASAERGERAIVVAADAQGVIVGTVSVIVGQPENQPHRADVAKMQVHRRARRCGVGERLLDAAERVAAEAGKTLLVLDTASADAERVYERAHWQRCGVIPNYALMPDGAYCDTVVYFKAL
jgi:GNAT superfamily N-acetyltransferase